MQIKVSNKALNWYKNELSLHEGDCVRFFVRYGGFNCFVTGYSLGIKKEQPERPGIVLKKDGITFFMEEDDVWYLDQKDLVIEFNETLDEPEFKQAV